MVRDEKDDRLLPHQIRRQRLTKGEKQLQKQATTDTRSKIPCRYTNIKIRHVDSGILPYVITTSLRPDAQMAKNADSDMLRLRRSPTKSQRKMVQRIICFVEGVHTIGLYLKILIRENLFYVKRENQDQNAPSNFPRAQMAALTKKSQNLCRHM